MNNCAPGINYDSDNNTCLSFEQLKKIITEHKKDIINIDNLSKKELIEIINNDIFPECNNNELCWAKKAGYEKFYKPQGPYNDNTWLKTSDINNVLTQYENIYDDFKFLGAVPSDIDEISTPMYARILNYMQKNKKRFGIVYNLDTHDGKGTHWVSVFIDIPKKHIYYFDSGGSKPPKNIMNSLLNIIKYINNDIEIYINRKIHQFFNSECGVYSISFILRMLSGQDIKCIFNHRVSDREIFLCRKEYFYKY